MMQGLVTELIARVALGHGVPALARAQEEALRRSFYESIFSVDAPSIHLRHSERRSEKLKPQPVYDLLSALTGSLSASGRATDAEALRKLVGALVHDVGVNAAADIMTVLSALEQPVPPRDDSPSFWMPASSSLEAPAVGADPALALLFQHAAPHRIDDSAPHVGLQGLISGSESASLSQSDLPVTAPAGSPASQRPRAAVTFEQLVCDEDAAGLAWDGAGPSGAAPACTLFGGLLGADAIGLFAAEPAIDELPQHVPPRHEMVAAVIDAARAMSDPGRHSADLAILPPGTAVKAAGAAVVAGASPARLPGSVSAPSSKGLGSSLLLLPDGALLPEAVLRAFSLHVLLAAAGLPSLTFPLEDRLGTPAGTETAHPTSPAPVDWSQSGRLPPTARLLFDANTLDTTVARTPHTPSQLAAMRSAGCGPSSGRQAPTVSLLAARCSAVGPLVAQMGSRVTCLEAAAAAWAAGTGAPAGPTTASPMCLSPDGCTGAPAPNTSDPARRVGTALQSYLRYHSAVMLVAHMQLDGLGAATPASERECMSSRHTGAPSLSPLRLWLQLEPWCARLADLQCMLGLAGWDGAPAPEEGIGGSKLLQRLHHSLSSYQLSDPPDGAWEGARGILPSALCVRQPHVDSGAHAIADSAVTALHVPAPPSRLALAAFLFGAGVGPLLRGICHVSCIIPSPASSAGSHASAAPGTRAPAVDRITGPSATLNTLLPLLTDAASPGVSPRSAATGWLQLQGSASQSMDLLRTHVPAAFLQLVEASASTRHPHSQRPAPTHLNSEAWPTLDGEYWASAAHARAAAAQQVEGLADWCARALRDRGPAATATRCEEEEMALRAALLRHLIPTLRSAAVAAFGPPAEPDQQPPRSNRVSSASEAAVADSAHDDATSLRPGLVEAAAAVGSLRQRGASAAAAAVRESRRQQSAAQEQARETHAAARRDEHSRLLLQAQEAAAAKAAAKAARKAAEALEARELADVRSPRRVDGSVIPTYSHRYASPTQSGAVAGSAIAESADSGHASTLSSPSAAATGQAEEAAGGSLVSHARIFLLQEYGQRLARLAGSAEDVSAVHADGPPASAAANDGSAAADAGRSAELLALDALGSLGPAGVQIASETAAALGLSWTADRLQRPVDMTATAAAGSASPSAAEGMQAAAAAPVAAAEAPAAGVPTVRPVSLLAALPSTRDRQLLFRSAARGQLGDVLFGSLPELAPLLPPVFLTHVRVSQPPGGHASAAGELGSPASRRRLRSAVPGRSSDRGEARGTNAYSPAPSPGSGRQVSDVFGAGPESPVRPSKRRLPTSGGHAPLNIFSSAAAESARAKEGTAPEDPANTGVGAAATDESSEHAAAGIRTSSSSSSTLDPEGAGGDRRHIRVAQPSGGVSDMGNLLFPGTGAEPSTHTVVAASGAADAMDEAQESAKASEGCGGGGGGTARSSPRPQPSALSHQPRSSVQVTQPSGGLSSIGDLLFPRAADAFPADSAHSAVPPPSQAGDEGRHSGASSDDTQGPGSPSGAASQQSGGGASTVQGLLYPDTEGTAPAVTTSNDGRSPRSERSRAAPGASASPAATALTHVAVSQPPGGNSSMRNLLEHSEASGTVSGRDSSGVGAADGSFESWASGGGPPSDHFKPSVRVRQPVGGAATVQYLLGAGSKPARRPADAISRSFHSQQLDSTSGDDGETARIDSGDDRFALLGLLTGRDTGELRMLPLGALDVMSAGPPGDGDGIRWPQLSACHPCALTVPVAHVTRTLIAAPLRCSLLLARAYGAVALLLQHDLLRHYAALRAWMLCGEGRVLTEVAEALLAHMHARARGSQHLLRIPLSAGGSPSAASSGVDAEADSASPDPARERAAPAPADVAAAANAALARMQADLGFSDRWGDYREEVLVRVQEALAVQDADAGAQTRTAEGDSGGRRDASLRAHGHLLARACGVARSSAAAALSGGSVRQIDGYWGAAVGGEAVQALHSALASVRGHQGLPSAVEHMHRFWYAEAPASRRNAAGKRSAAAGAGPASLLDALLPRYSADAHPLAEAPAEGRCNAALAGDAAGVSPARSFSSPLSLVLTPACMARYGRVHVFLLRLRVCALAVQKLWVQLMQADGSGRRSSVPHSNGMPAASLRPLYLFRHEASLLVRAIEEHCMRQLQHECYGFLLRHTVTTGSSVESLAAVHDASTRMMLARCMLPEQAQADPASGKGAPAGSPHDSLLRAGAARLQGLLGMVVDACGEASQAVEATAGAAPATATRFDASQPLRQLRQEVAVLVAGLRHLVASGGVQAAHLQELLAQLEALRPAGP